MLKLIPTAAITAALALVTLTGATATASAYGIFLGKAEAKNQATGYARHICNDLEHCLDVTTENSYDCKRISAIQVECDVLFTFDDDIECTQTIRVTERTRYYNRRLVYSADCT